MDLTTAHEPPLAGTETEALIGSLNRLRSYLLWKCGGLDADGIRATLGPSAITLGGLLKHLSAVEATTFAWKLHGRRPFPPFDTWNWDDEHSHWRVEADDTPASLEALFKESVAKGQALVDEAIAAGGLGGQADVSDDEGNHANVRRVVLDMIEEYGRHVGHADLIRVSVAGLVGEDPPVAYGATGGPPSEPQTSSGRSTRSMTWPICGLPLLTSTSVTRGLRRSGSASTRVTFEPFTRTVTVPPCAVVSFAPSDLSTLAAPRVLPGTTW
jgi:hypothetical protein